MYLHAFIKSSNLVKVFGYASRKSALIVQLINKDGIDHELKLYSIQCFY